MEVVGDFVGGGVSLSGSGGRVEEWQRWYRLMMDKSTTWIKTRWSVFAALLVIFCFRIFYLQGWYISAYALGINLLNLFIGFITPQKDPQTQQYILPVAAQNSSSHASEYRPFLRQVPEFTFWHHGTISVLVALATTFFTYLDLPVFWPVLVIYFIFLLFITLRHQIADMRKHGYIPFSRGKVRYGDVSSAPKRGGKILL